MGKSSKSITLALIGSALLLSGCGRDEDEGQDWEQDPNQKQASGGHRAGGGVFIVPRVGGGFGGGGAPGVGGSARGGFGSSGAHGVGA